MASRARTTRSTSSHRARRQPDFRMALVSSVTRGPAQPAPDGGPPGVGVSPPPARLLRRAATSGGPLPRHAPDPHPPAAHPRAAERASSSASTSTWWPCAWSAAGGRLLRRAGPAGSQRPVGPLLPALGRSDRRPPPAGAGAHPHRPPAVRRGRRRHPGASLSGHSPLPSSRRRRSSDLLEAGLVGGIGRGAALVGDAHEQGDQDVVGDQRRAAVGDEGKGDPGQGQEPDHARR